MLSVIKSLRARWRPLDWVLTRVEAYTALVEQYPALRHAVGWLGAGVLGLWTWLGESWIPIALVVFLGTYVALSFFPRAVRSGALQAQSSEPNEAHLEQINTLRTEVHEVSQGLATLGKTFVSGMTLSDQGRERVSEQLTDLATRVAKIETALRPKPEGLLGSGQQFENRLDAIEAKIRGADEAIGASIRQLRGNIEADGRQSQLLYRILASSLRARDAQAIFNEADTKALHLGGELLQANKDRFPDGKTWAECFEAWRRHVQTIDNLMNQWDPHHQPFLDIRLPDLEQSALPPPPHIVTETDANSVRYKTVWLVQRAYASRRDNISKYFAHKASELPS